MKLFTKPKIVLVVVLIAFVATIIIPCISQAIPAFARKYRMSCNTCHAPIPRLKAYGDDFAGNGFVLADQDAPRFYVDTGDEELDLIREFPFAVRMDGYLKYQSETDKDFDFSAPYNLKLLSGGALTKDIAYYFYFYFSEHGEIVGIEDAYLMFNNLFGQDLDVYIGQFAVSDPLFKGEVRLTYEGYQIYKARVGDSSSSNLSYDRGLMVTLGLETGTDIILEIVNGNGLPEADDFRVFDNDKYKNFAGRISQDVAEFLRLGAFGYYGQEGMTYTNKLWMAGGDMTLAYDDKLELNLQYLHRNDDNPCFEEVKPPEVETKGGFAELIFMPNGERSRLYGTLLYNKIDSDDDNIDYESFTTHIGYMVQTNLRLIAENVYDIENEEHKVIVGFVSGF